MSGAETPAESILKRWAISEISSGIVFAQVKRYRQRRAAAGGGPQGTQWGAGRLP